MPDRFRFYLYLALLSALSFSGYLLACHWQYRLGFPLDDAWIHQTYARNLALNGEWSFIPGQPSAGSTSPLWSGVLSLGYLLGWSPYLWTFLLGWAALLSSGIFGAWAFGALCPQRRRSAAWAGAFLVFEWHLVWAAASGMETLFFALLALAVLSCLAAGSAKWFGLGVLIGVSAWVRPDGLTLLGPALLVLYFSERSWKARLQAALRLGLGVILLVAPYLIFNYALSGAAWPNTFFAKQAEYAVHRQQPLGGRFLAQLSLPLVGAGAILLPGFIYFFLRAFQARAWGALAGALWFLGYLLLYALRLPVVYQHGRYVMPAMPVYFLWALVGMSHWIAPASTVFWRRILSRAWLASLVATLLAFWLLGAQAYARDVAIIESEMVVTARWLADHTEPEALVAAHDIGALGYFSQRELLDLAGLVSPEVIPFIRDEQRLADFLDARGADYLVAFPGWYPGLSQRAEQIFSTNGEFSPALGGENMTVYRWQIAR
ncbi:MAG: hypothetical protein JXA78_06240 [Anaerolineales bacterium]|nr:hypothetical protein [Anaerolineales bacterium]